MSEEGDGRRTESAILCGTIKLEKSWPTTEERHSPARGTG